MSEEPENSKPEVRLFEDEPGVDTANFLVNGTFCQAEIWWEQRKIYVRILADGESPSKFTEIKNETSR